ncbi:MAG: hypothetical protein ACR2OC_13500 [Solirubrobacterales bacterium]
MLALAVLAPAAAHAAGPVGIAVDGEGTSYAGFGSGGLTRYQLGTGARIDEWKTPVADANGLLGPIVAIAAAPAGTSANGGAVWVLDANLRVQEFSPTGSFLRGFRLDPCDASESPAPGVRGGLDVTSDSIYVAHPCANAVLRFKVSDLPARGSTVVAPAAMAQVYMPHGISTPDEPSAPGAGFLFVAEPLRVLRLDPTTLADGCTVPVTHTGRPDDVFVAGAQGRLFVSETENSSPGYSHRIYAYDGDGAGNFNEAFHVGGPGSDLGRFNGVRSFDVFTPPGGPGPNIFVADFGNERVQRLSADASGFTYWASPAPDPGPFVDDVAPSVKSATLRRLRGDWVLRVEAVDAESGLFELGIGKRRRGEFKTRPFERSTEVSGPRRVKFVQVGDLSGNLSKVVKVRRG